MDLIELKKVRYQNFLRHPWELARVRILLFFLKKLNLSSKLITDIGSGDAFIAKEVTIAFPDVSVIAADINYTEEIKKKIALNTENISFVSDMKMIKEQNTASPDVVILMDVLEHIENPGHFLEEVKKTNNIDSHTHFFVTVPAFQLLFSNHDQSLGHFKRYTRKELTRLLKLHSFQIQHSGYFFTGLLAIRLMEKIFQKKISTGLYNWNGGNLITS